MPLFTLFFKDILDDALAIIIDHIYELVYKRMMAEQGACEGKMMIARKAKALNLDAIHDTVHEMAKDEARHGKGFEGLYNRYFKD